MLQKFNNRTVLRSIEYSKAILYSRGGEAFFHRDHIYVVWVLDGKSQHRMAGPMNN